MVLKTGSRKSRNVAPSGKIISSTKIDKRRKLSRKDRADCRKLAQLGHTQVEIAQRYGCSRMSISRAINNEFKEKDNLDSDDEHCETDTDGQIGQVIYCAQPRPQKSWLGRPSRAYMRHIDTVTPPEAPMEEPASANTRMPSSEEPPSPKTPPNREEALASPDSHFAAASRRSTLSPSIIPTPLSAVTCRDGWKRKMPDEEGASPKKVPRTEVVQSRGQGSKVSSAEAETVQNRPVHRVSPAPGFFIPASPSEAASEPDADADVHLASLQLECPLPDSGSLTPNAHAGRSAGISEAGRTLLGNQTDARDVVTLPPSPSSIFPPPKASEGHVSAAALGDGASAIASFLKSVKPDLSAHLDTFLGLGIKDVEYLAAMRLWTREHVKGFLDNGKFTPFEVHALLHALFE